jgi:hypothetical protein
MTTGPSYRHLLYAYKLTTCSFVCMGTGEAGPSSFLWQDESRKFYCHIQIIFYPIYWTLQIVLHVILIFGCIMFLIYKFYLLNLGMFCKLQASSSLADLYELFASKITSKSFQAYSLAEWILWALYKESAWVYNSVKAISMSLQAWFDQ